jgi:hypothetical protein
MWKFHLSVPEEGITKSSVLNIYRLRLTSITAYRINARGWGYKDHAVNDVQGNEIVSSEILTKHINALCGQDVKFLKLILGDTYRNHYALKG